ncbi:MAG TPA: uL22 family ribosomal protein [archaeon]|nr:uL22 family ribosomal protein [archaeon]
MPYTFAPEEKHAKAYGSNLRISPKTGHLICNMIKRKKFNVAKSMLEDMYAGKRSMKGKYYTKTVKEMLDLLASCEKNAQVLGLDMDKLFVHASSHKGTMLRRRRRKSGYGSIMKTANVEMMLIERGKQSKPSVAKTVKK